MAAEGTGDVDSLFISMGGDDTDYRLMVESVISNTTKAANQVQRDTTSMAEVAAREALKAANGLDVYTKAIERARDAQGKFTKETREVIDANLFAKSNVAPFASDKGMGQAIDEAKIRMEAGTRMAQMWGTATTSAVASVHGATTRMSGGNVQAANTLHHLHASLQDVETIAFRASRALHHYGGTASVAADAVMGFTSIAEHGMHLASGYFYLRQLGGMAGGAAAGGAAGTAGTAAGVAGAAPEAAAGIGGIAAAATTGAAVLATFAGTLGLVTYAISGWEGIKHIPANMFEGLKYILYGATAGYVDFTAKTAAAKEATKSLEQTMLGGRAQMQATITERIDMIRSLSDEVNKLTDHSEKAEKAFSEKFIGKLGQLGGIHGELSEQLRKGDVAQAFSSARVDELVKKLEDEAKTYGMTKKELMEYNLEQNHATDAQKEAARTAYERIAATDKWFESQHKMDELEREAAQEAKRRAEEQKRERERIVKEGESFHNALRTSWEKLQDEAKHAESLFKKGVISIDDYQRTLKKLEAGPKEHTHKLKLVTEHEIGSKPGEFGSAEDMAQREAYLLNRQVEKMNKEGLATPEGLDARIRAAGGTPVHKATRINEKGQLVPSTTLTPGSKALTPEELETRRILNEMKEFMRTVASNTSGKNFVTISPARLGGGR